MNYKDIIMNYFNYLAYEVVKQSNLTDMNDIKKVVELVNTYFTNSGISYEDISIVHNSYDLYKEFYYNENTIKIINAILEIAKNNFCENVKIPDKIIKNIVMNSITNISKNYNIPIKLFKVNLEETDYISTLQIILDNGILLYENKKCIKIFNELSTDIIESLRYDPFTTKVSDIITSESLPGTIKIDIIRLTIKIEYDN